MGREQTLHTFQQGVTVFQHVSLYTLGQRLHFQTIELIIVVPL